MIKSFEELVAWQRAMELCELVYRMQKALPKTETYGLGDQIRRAVVSIPSNIAEGFGRESTKDFLHFLMIARGSLFETQTQIKLAVRLGCLQPNHDFDTLSVEVGRLINGLAAKLRTRLATNP